MKVVLENVQFLSMRATAGSGGAGTSATAATGDDVDQTSPERHSPPARSAGPKASAAGNIDEDVPFWVLVSFRFRSVPLKNKKLCQEVSIT